MNCYNDIVLSMYRILMKNAMNQKDPGIEFWHFTLIQLLIIAALAITGIYLYLLVIKYLRLRIQ